ncbi:MAG: MBL fold metallo-hydrolase [Treponema sp.]|nr:MBL fold metallo-hydrolase [Treponema sp.]
MTTTGLDFVQLTPHIGYFMGATNIGVVTMPHGDETLLWLIDSPNTLVLTKYLWEQLETMYPFLKLVAIINTHSHADHCGGNVFLQEQTGCQIWATKGESVLMELPILQSALVYGGSPIKDIESKYLKADPCKVDRILTEETFSLCDGLSVTPISLPGHYIDMAAMLIHDEQEGKKVCFLADGISGRNVIKRYWIQYLFNEKQFRLSLLKIKEIKADFYVPGHGDMVREIEGLVELNMIAVLETETMIEEELSTPLTFEELLKAVADRNQIPLKVSQFELIGSTVRSYLSSLYEDGRIAYDIIDNRMLWHKADKA